MNPKPLLPASAVAVLLLAAPPSVFAWSANGHRTVGQIAQDLLQKQAQAGDAQSQAALNAITNILGQGVSLAAIAPCADQIRRFDEETGQVRAAGGQVSCGGLQLTVNPASEPWHFVNVDITQPDTADAIAAQCGGDACVVNQIKDDVQALQNPNAATTDLQTALMYLVHFVGDEHQPLHCATEFVNGAQDYGGNEKQVSFQGQTLNMHALWDHLIEFSDDTNDPNALSQQLESSLPADTSAWTQGDFVVGAAIESLGIAQQTVYPAYYDAATGGGGSSSGAGFNAQATGANSLDQTRGPAVSLPSDYQSQMQPIVMQRLQMAGVRLAALLKQALGGAPVPAAPSAAARVSGEQLQRAAVPPKW